MAVRILVIGHSHVASVQRGVHRPQHQWVNFRFQESVVQFQFVYEGGARTEDLLISTHRSRRQNRLAYRVHNTINMFRPHALWIWIGDNDVANSGETPEELGLRIFNTAASLSARHGCIHLTSIIQLLPRHVGARGDVDAYNTAAAEVNATLMTLCLQTGRHLHFARVNFRFPIESPRRYRNDGRSRVAHDGVHLNIRGLRKLMLRLRHAVIIALRVFG